MGYGLKVTTGSGNTILQIDSDTLMKDYVCVGGASSSSTIPNSFSLSEDIVFVNTSVSSGQYKTLFLVDDNGTYRFTGQTNPANVLTNAGMAYVSASYILLKPITALSNPSGSYGLVVYNSANQIAFDSRYYTASFNASIIDYHQPVSRSGNPNVDSPLISDISAYPVLDTFNTALGGDLLNPTRKAGFLFANNHSTYGTGIYWLSFQQSFFGPGGSYQANHGGNLIGKSI